MAISEHMRNESLLRDYIDAFIADYRKDEHLSFPQELAVDVMVLYAQMWRHLLPKLDLASYRADVHRTIEILQCFEGVLARLEEIQKNST